MEKIWNCLTVEHDSRYVLVAAFLCASGCTLSFNLFDRARQAGLLQRLHWLFLAAALSGATMWSTHFIVMMGYRIEGVAGFDPYMTAFSFVVAVCASLAGFAIATYGGRGLLVEAGGLVLGMAVSATHYLGMAAYFVQGSLVWDGRLVLVSVAVSLLLGVFSMNRAVRASSGRFRYGGAAVLFLSIIVGHYIGMGAVSLDFDPTAAIRESFMTPAITATGAIIVIVALMSSGFATYRIDLQSAAQAMERYRHLSLHDPLTGVANRVRFNEHLAKVVERANAIGAGVALLSFDLDRFKEINDVHGHAAGDLVLQTVAQRASSALGVREFLARMGGDEFCGLIENYYARNDAVDFARRLQKEITQPIDWQGHRLSVGVSFGISVLSPEMRGVDELFTQADVAMYRAKAGASGTICFYDKRMDEAVIERNALATAMRAGLSRGEFELYFQQQNVASSGAIAGFEALLRWRHPDRGMVSPSEFIPLAEKSGFIVVLGEWVLAKACREAAGWTLPLEIAVNVAPQQLADRAFTTKVEAILRETGLAPERLELEITETTIIADHAHALSTIRRLKALGVRIAMDDYGRGHSSLSTLQSFPFDKIKLDRSFVEGLPDSLQSDAIVRSTLILANSLGIVVLAEGVETQAQLDYLRREGCPYVQGFFFGKPQPASVIASQVSGQSDADADPAGPLKVAS